MNRVPVLLFANEIDNMALHARAATVSTEVGKIDYATVDSMQIVPGARSTPDGAAIAFDWGADSPRVTTRQLGYLTGAQDATSKYQSSLNNMVSLQILGVGNTMRDTKSRAWNNAKISEVLADVLGPHRVNLVMDDHDTRWTRIAQQNESDWALVLKLADKIGYWPYLHNTTLYVVNPDTLATRQDPTTIIPAAAAQLSQQTSDMPQVGDTTVSDRTGRFVDQATGIVHKIAADARVQVASALRPVTGRADDMPIMHATHAEAQAVLAGTDRKSAWYIERKITLDGRSDLKPLMPVVIPNQRVVRTHTSSVGQGWEQYDGIWLVKGVNSTLKFHYDNFSYLTEVTVVRDSRGPGLNVRQQRQNTLSFDNQPTTKLLDGKWAAAWRTN